MKTVKNKKNILIVDDSETSGILLKSFLEEKNIYNIKVVNSGKKAFALDKSNFSLIFLDLMMPDVSGFEILKLLKAEEKTKNIPVVIVSANSNKSSINTAKLLGASNYIVKPIEEDIFLEQLDLIK